MQEAFPRCPECTGVRAFFDYYVGGQLASIDLGGWNKRITLYACVCLECGYTTMRPLPIELDKLRRSVEKRPRKG